MFLSASCDKILFGEKLFRKKIIDFLEKSGIIYSGYCKLHLPEKIYKGKNIMQKLIRLLAAAALVLAFSSCSSPKPVNIDPIYNEERIEYDVDSMDISIYEENIYIFEVSPEKGENISVFDGTGKKLREFDMKNGHSGTCDIADGTIYTVYNLWEYDELGEYAPSRMILYSTDIETGDSEEICCFKNISYVYKVRAVGDKLYWIGTKKDAQPFEESILTSDDTLIYHSDLGNVFGYVDLNKGEIVETDISHPVAFSERNGRIYVYNYEEGKGYQFCDYTANAVICKTNKIKNINDFEIINDNADFVFTISDVQSPYVNTLTFTGMDNTSGIIQLDDGIYPYGFSAEGDYLCLSGGENFSDNEHKVYKYYVGNVSTENPPIRVITDSDIVRDFPLFSCGYQIKKDRLSSGEFSLTVLSLDKNYDMVMLDSSESCANEIKSKGSFYPLNDIPGVKEYIDGCFPGLKEAATDENGDIWMLPVSVDVPVIRYNVKNCAEKGISFSSDLSDFISNMNKAYDYPEYFFCESYTIARSMLTSYLSENDRFDTDTFRSFADIIRKNYFNKALRNDSKVSSAFYNNMLLAKGGHGSPDSELYKEIYDKALFALTPYLSDQKKSIGDENLLAAPIPTVNGVNSAFCTFISVNPNSEHLEETLLFIEKTVSRFANKKNGFTMADRTLYEEDPYTRSLYDIYANSKVFFTVPWEIYQDDFESCAKGVLELEDFIAEADRKLSAYLYE